MSATAVQLDVPFLVEAELEARALAHSYVAPEHLFIALAIHGRSACARFFEAARLDADAIRVAVRDLVGTSRDALPNPTDPLRLSHRAQLAIAAAIELAHARRHPETAYADVDLLRALLSDQVATPAVVEAILNRAGLTPAAARETFAALGAPAS